MMNSEDVFRGSITFVAALFVLAVGFEIFREAADHRRAQDDVVITPGQPGLTTNATPLVRSWSNRTGPGAYSGPPTGMPVSTETPFQ